MDTLQLLLAVCTVLGGLSAIVYFHERLRLPSLALLRRRIFGHPKVPLNPSSISAYVHTSPRSRDLDLAIAGDFNLPLERSDSDCEYLMEEVKALGLENVQQLDRLGAKHSGHARLLARTFRPSGSVAQAFGLQLVLEIEAMERFGADWYDKYLSGLSLTSTDKGFAKSLWSYYQQVKAYGA